MKSEKVDCKTCKNIYSLCDDVCGVECLQRMFSHFKIIEKACLYGASIGQTDVRTSIVEYMCYMMNLCDNTYYNIIYKRLESELREFLTLRGAMTMQIPEYMYCKTSSNDV